MKQFITILLFEFRHFIRSPFKITAFVLFIAAAVYGLQKGYELFLEQHTEIAALNDQKTENIQQVLTWFDEGKKGPENRPNIDITTPFWAIWRASSIAYKIPSPLMPFSIGQAEQFGYYKNVSVWSSVYDADLAEEVANPERLAIGTLDFSFVLLFLLPVLSILLLFNIGGLEKDLGFNSLIQVNNISGKNWLISRFAFYFLILITGLVALMLPYAMLSGALNSGLFQFLKLLLYIVFYTLLWFLVFYFVNLYGSGSVDQALKMLAVWLLFCILIPGAIHQVVSLKYPASYMTDFIDVNRAEAYKIWDLPNDSVNKLLVEAFPELAGTHFGRDTASEPRVIGQSSGLINLLRKEAVMAIENNNENKNRFIKITSPINPVTWFQNKLNAISGTDYYAYAQFRTNIQTVIDKKIHTLLMDGWNKETVNKEKYLQYVEHFKN